MNKTILLADDDESFLNLYRQIIEKAGFNVIVARDGIEVLETALSSKPDMVVLDVGMPKKDGLAVAEEIRKTDWGKNIPIIILTGNEPTDAQLDSVIVSNPTYYFVKGNENSEDFVSKIKDVLDRK